MAYQFIATRGVELKALRFPFPLRWHSERGILQLSTACGGELVCRGSNVPVRPEELFDVQMAPDETGAVAGRLELGLTVKGPLLEPDWDTLTSIYSSNGRGFGLALAQNMFRLPWYPWSLENVASQLDTKPRALQMTLFRECYSFDAALRRCRRLDTLLREGNAHCSFERVTVSAEDAATKPGSRIISQN
ncbi:hypothetical protein [Burkholderia sp. Ac-20353]|uniref:hypothetical protein n=1 Tax=Burkholderia sp. Ac-20353 TaxID=2703894 RepID=UPI00197BF327|nr:hypothetical protein [Burkholderia sp. Ac-20353]MBN3793055.1 hypothetical protein [Burkholderia sp. Ac-20353]